MNSVSKSIWRTKLFVFKAMLLPILLYESEIWTLSNALESRLDAFCDKSVCQIMGYSCPTNSNTMRLAWDLTTMTTNSSSMGT